MSLHSLHPSTVSLAFVKALPLILCCTGIAFFLASTPQLTAPFTERLLYRLTARSDSSATPTSPSWHDFLRIQQHTRDLSARNVVAPTYLRHLEEFHAPDPFKTVHIVSSWVDTRPLIVDRPPQLSIIATQQGAPFIQVSNGSRYEDNPLFCYIALKKAGQTSLYTVTKSTLNGLPDVHELERHFVAVQYNCPLVLSNGDVPDWEGAEVLVTLSLAHVDPPLDVFTLATPLPILDLPRHIQGHGKSAVCIPPLTGDRYAPFIRDFIAYYQALGFTDFYAYLFSPGPESIEVLRDISTSNGIHTIRWGVPKAWTWSATQNHDPSRKFPVDPRNWNIAGIETLVPEKEYEMSGDTNGEFDILLWYYGQGAATQDCASRAMAEGMRWVAHVDWDEYLFLRPSGGQAWPPASTAAGGSAFTEWARTAEQLWTYPETLAHSTALQLGVDVGTASKATLPASFTFVSGFACLRCRPTSPPPESEGLHNLHKKYPQVDWLNPGFGLPLFMSSPVRQERWFGQSRRTKFVTDPWAWWSVGIHMTGLGYAEHAATRGFCSSSWTPSPHSLRSSEDSECARKLLSTLGRNTVLVRAAPPTITSSPPSSEFGQGSIFHFRVDNKLSKALSTFNEIADTFSWDVVEGEEGSRAFDEFRVEKRNWQSLYGSEDRALVQDWSIVEVMGPALLPHVLAKKTKYGAQRWPLDEERRMQYTETALVIVALVLLCGILWRTYYKAEST